MFQELVARKRTVLSNGVSAWMESKMPKHIEWRGSMIECSSVRPFLVRSLCTHHPWIVVVIGLFTMTASVQASKYEETYVRDL